MRREGMIGVRVTHEERRILEKLAQREFIAPATWLRRRMLQEAEKEGLLNRVQENENGGEK